MAEISQILTVGITSWKRARILHNYAEVSSVPEFGIYRDERPLPGRPAAFPLSDGVTRPDLRAQSFPAFRFPLWANAEQQRRSHEFLNPPSTFQANLDAVSPESQGLFLQCNPDQPDEDAGEDPRDPYWTWSRDRQQWFHIDKERGVVVWCPEEFD
ncbi:hypothetical protein GGS23DRAFT_594307 [Durotheca rogersii]|uniref:uncharacterized protein n=1 Tax=Durotheca rogersii TaxID=419775 RepID=UPI0022210796|nr:uncharacterized protein GGS23DRAFT_594307 [Durotheca rogersii]KAI5866166.1 hypothetical protein GGS23DRAFT_594307 [Durotheca rogersii]